MVADKEIKLNNKTTWLYKIFCFTFVFLILLSHVLLFKKDAPFNPLALSTILLSFSLMFKKLTCSDLLFASKFSILVIIILLLATIFNGLLGYPEKYLTVFVDVYVLILGMLWGTNNPTGNLVLLKRKYKDLSLFTIFFYPVFGIATCGIAFFLFAFALGPFYQTIAQTLLEVLAVLVSFYGSIIFFSSITNIFCWFIVKDTPKECVIAEHNLINEDNDKQSKYYKITIGLCSLSIVIFIIIGFIKLGSLSAGIIPAIVIFLFLAYKLSIKKYSYEKTIIIDKNTLWVFGGLLCLALVTLGLGSSVSSELIIFNYNFYILSYSIIFVLLSALLSFNNNVNSYNFYIKIYNLGYSNIHLFFSVIFIAIIGGYAVHDALSHIQQVNLPNFVITMVVASFTSLLTARFIGFLIIYCQQLSHK